MKKLFVAAITIMLLLTSTACGSSKPKMAEDQTMYMTFAASNLVTNNDFLPPWRDGSIVTGLLWRTLIKADANLVAAKDDLMTDWGISEDGLTVTMKLRDNQFWSDGKPITMDDIIFTFESYCDKYGTASWSYVREGMKYIEGYNEYNSEEVDHLSGLVAEGNSLTIKLTSPYASFLNLMAQVAPLPVHIYGEVEKTGFTGNDIWQEIKVNSGMYKITEHVQGSYFVLEPNEYYKDAEPKIKKIVFNVTSSNSTSAQAGQCDYFQTDSADDYIVMSNLNGYHLKAVPVIYYRFLLFNLNDADGNNKGIVDDARIRKALALGVDWKSLIGTLFGEQASFTQSGVLSNSEFYNGDWYSYDPDQAKKLLDEAGYDYSHTLKIFYYYADQTTKDVMDGIIYYMDKIGVKVDAVYTNNTSVDVYTGKTHDVALFGLSAYDNLSYYQMFKRANIQAFFDEGAKKYIDKTNELQSAFDKEDYKEIITQLQKWEQEDAYFLPIYTLNYQTWFKNTVVTPDDLQLGNDYFFYNHRFEEWYIAE